MFLMVDNYDSFSYNLAALIEGAGRQIRMIRNDEYISAENYDAIIISPGPSSPEHSGNSLRYIEEYRGSKPIFGVCLGMQAIALHEGFRVSAAPSIMHGREDTVRVIKRSILFNGLPDSFKAVRYHSLSVQSSGEWATSVSDTDGAVMSYEDEENMLFGVQFHPESILSEFGKEITENFINYVSEAKDGRFDKKN